MADAAVPVPGYSHLRYIGAATAPAEQQDTPAFLRALDSVGAALGKVIDIFSGSGGPSVRGGGGFVGDPHDLNIAADATINGVPIGNYPGAVQAIHTAGLRSGATDFLYHGVPDPAHVDAVGSVTGTSSAAPAGITTTHDYWAAVLKYMGAPVTDNNIVTLQGWAQAEGTSAKNNPLATTLKLPGSSGLPGNPDGVQQYSTPEQGAEATARTITNGFYPTITRLLRHDQGFATIPQGQSPELFRELNVWSGNSKLGAAASSYVNNVLQAVQGMSNGGSAADWLSFDGNDAANAAADAAKKVAKKVVPWASGLADLIGKVMDSHTWWRVGIILAGGLLILGALANLAKSSGMPMPAVIPV